jgi:hypothetical protein
VIISRAVKTYCGDDNGRGSGNRTQRKNTAIVEMIMVGAVEIEHKGKTLLLWR